MNLTPQQVAERLNVCTKTVYRIIQSGALSASKLSYRCIRISEADLNSYLESKKQ